MYKLRSGSGARFADLLAMVSEAAPAIRFRFTSPHPKDFPNSLLDVIAERPNVCKQIHIPAQSGNTEMLFRMRRNHSRESYLSLIENIRAKVPSVALSSDFICGFCEETETEFEDTLSLIDIVGYDLAFLFAYSMRERTHAHRRMNDSVPAEVKQERLVRMIDLFKRRQLEKQMEEVGAKHLVLVDGFGKKGATQMKGLTDTMKRAVFNSTEYRVGDLVLVEVIDATQNTLFTKPLRHLSIQEYHDQFSENRFAEALIP